MTTTIEPPRAGGAPVQSTPRRARFRTARMLLSERRTRVVLALLVLLVLVAFVGPLFSPYGSNEQDILDRLRSPSGAHWLGTDSLGRDILTLVLHGTRLSLLAGLLAVGTAVVLGTPAGLLAGYRAGPFGAITNTVSDTLLALPPLVLALAVVGAYGGGVVPAMLAVGITLSPRFYRVARSVAATVSKDAFVEAARSIGCSTTRILTRHVLANAVAPIVVQVTFSIGLAIIAEASLSFLGVGAAPPSVSLGTMARDAFTHIREAAFPIFPPCIVIAVIVFLFSSLGDGLRDAVVSGGRRT